MKSPEIDNNAYDSLLKMLNSTDEDKLVALTTIENIDRKKNYCKVLLLYKNGSPDYSLWNEHAPKTCKWVANLGLKGSAPTYQSIFNVLIKKKASSEDMEFFLEDFMRVLKDRFKNFGYEFINSIDIKLTYKDGQKRELSESV